MASISFPLQFQRQNSGPLDTDLVFPTTAERLAYLNRAIRYPGQIVSDLQDGLTYKLNQSGTAWERIEFNSTAIAAASGSWNTAYTNLISNSAAYLSAVDLSLVAATSGSWDTAYTNLVSNSAAYLSAVDLSLVATASANWDSVYSNVKANSGTYVTIQNADTKYFPVSGGIVTGNFTVYGNISASGTQTFSNTVFNTTSALSVVNTGPGTALWIGNNGPGDIASFYDIDENIEVLHIGGHNSNYPNVGVKVSNPNKTLTVNGEISANNTIWDSAGNSIQWNAAFTNLISNSAAYLSGADLSLVAEASANWNSVYSNVASTSANWNSVYSNVNSNSANYVKLTGGTLTGGLTGTNATFNSVSAAAFYGDGSYLTGVATAGNYLSASGGTLLGGLTGTEATFNSVSAVSLSGTFYGDGSHLTGIAVGAGDSIKSLTNSSSVSCGYDIMLSCGIEQIWIGAVWTSMPGQMGYALLTSQELYDSIEVGHSYVIYNGSNVPITHKVGAQTGIYIDDSYQHSIDGWAIRIPIETIPVTSFFDGSTYGVGPTVTIVAGKVKSDALIEAPAVSATAFYGDASHLTGIVLNSIGTSASYVAVASSIEIKPSNGSVEKTLGSDYYGGTNFSLYNSGPIIPVPKAGDLIKIKNTYTTIVTFNYNPYYNYCSVQVADSIPYNQGDKCTFYPYGTASNTFEFVPPGIFVAPQINATNVTATNLNTKHINGNDTLLDLVSSGQISLNASYVEEFEIVSTSQTLFGVLQFYVPEYEIPVWMQNLTSNVSQIEVIGRGAPRTITSVEYYAGSYITIYHEFFDTASSLVAGDKIRFYPYGSQNTSKLTLDGKTKTVYTNALSAQTIVTNSVSAVSLSGVFYGDGSHLTGIATGGGSGDSIKNSTNTSSVSCINSKVLLTAGINGGPLFSPIYMYDPSGGAHKLSLFVNADFVPLRLEDNQDHLNDIFVRINGVDYSIYVMQVISDFNQLLQMTNYNGTDPIPGWNNVSSAKVYGIVLNFSENDPFDAQVFAGPLKYDLSTTIQLVGYGMLSPGNVVSNSVIQAPSLSASGTIIGTTINALTATTAVLSAAQYLGLPTTDFSSLSVDHVFSSRGMELSATLSSIEIKPTDEWFADRFNEVGNYVPIRSAVKFHTYHNYAANYTWTFEGEKSFLDLGYSNKKRYLAFDDEQISFDNTAPPNYGTITLCTNQYDIRMYSHYADLDNYPNRLNLNIVADVDISYESQSEYGKAKSIGFITNWGANTITPNLSVDGVPVTVKWLGGSGQSSGETDSYDIWTFTIIQNTYPIGNNPPTYLVLGNVARYH